MLRENHYVLVLIIFFVCTTRAGSKYLCGCMYTTKCFIGQAGCCPGLTCQPIDNRGTTQCLESSKYQTTPGCVQTNQNGCSTRNDCCNPSAVCSRYRNCVLNSTCTYNYIPPDPTSRPTKTPTVQPLMHPSASPTSQPKHKPSRQPSRQPFKHPTGQPSKQPRFIPTNHPTKQPTFQPFKLPTQQPTRSPYSKPSLQPDSRPSVQPTTQPTFLPFSLPTHKPSQQPSKRPMHHPTSLPSRQPSVQPVTSPSKQPSKQPFSRPFSQPTDQPSSQPSYFPSSTPSTQPSRPPSRQPNMKPSSKPSKAPSSSPSSQPVGKPSNQPLLPPSSHPSDTPSLQPQRIPTHKPSSRPSVQPSRQPSSSSLEHPTCQPSRLPSTQPISSPSKQPRQRPSQHPSHQPFSSPSVLPSGQPRSQPTEQPFSSPSLKPANIPSVQPIASPSKPTSQPSIQPQSSPLQNNWASPTFQPVSNPTSIPTLPLPKVSALPTRKPTCQPSKEVGGPTNSQPIYSPTVNSSIPRSKTPSCFRSIQPSKVPSTSIFVRSPSSRPTLSQASSQPLKVNITYPTSKPSTKRVTYPTLSSAPVAQSSNGPSDLQKPTITPVVAGRSLPPAAESSSQTLPPLATTSSLPLSQELSTVSPTLLQSSSSRPTPFILPSPQPNTKQSQPADLRAAMLLVNMTESNFDVAYKIALRNTLEQAISPLIANISISSNVRPLGRRVLLSNLQCTAVISVSTADPQFQDILARYIISSVQTSVISGKATDIFRSELHKAGVQNVGYPIIKAVDIYLLTAPPTMAPTMASNLAGSDAGQTAGISTSLLYGIVGGVSVFWCMFLPFLYMMVTKVRKSYKVSTYEGDKDDAGSPVSGVGESNSGDDDATYYSKKFGNVDDMSFSKLYNRIEHSNMNGEEDSEDEEEEDDDEVVANLPVRSFYKTSNHKAAGNISEDNISFSKIYVMDDRVQDDKSYESLTYVTTEEDINMKGNSSKPKDVDDLSISQIYATLSASLEELKAAHAADTNVPNENAVITDGTRRLSRTKYSFFAVNPKEKNSPGSRHNSTGSQSRHNSPGSPSRRLTSLMPLSNILQSAETQAREEANSGSGSSSSNIASKVTYFSSMSTPVRFLSTAKLTETGSNVRRGTFKFDDMYPDERGGSESDAAPEFPKQQIIAANAQSYQGELHDSEGKVASGVNFFSRNFNSPLMNSKHPSGVILTTAKSQEKVTTVRDKKPPVGALKLDSDGEDFASQSDFFVPPLFQNTIPPKHELAGAPSAGQAEKNGRSSSPLYRSSPRLSKAANGVDQLLPPLYMSTTTQESECRSSSPLYRSPPRYGVASSPAPKQRKPMAVPHQFSTDSSQPESICSSSSTLSTSYSKKKLSRTHSKFSAASYDSTLRSTASFYKNSKNSKSPPPQVRYPSRLYKASTAQQDGSFRSTSPLYRSGQRSSSSKGSPTPSDNGGGGGSNTPVFSPRLNSKSIRSEAISASQREESFSPPTSRMTPPRVDRQATGTTTVSAAVTSSQQDNIIRSSSPLYRSSPRYSSPNQQKATTADGRHESGEGIYNTPPNVSGLLENDLTSPTSVKFKEIKSTFETMIQQNSKLSRHAKALNTPT